LRPFSKCFVADFGSRSLEATRQSLPAPWRVERIPGGYVVCDANDQNLAYVYSRANENEARQAKVLTSDERRSDGAGFEAALGGRACGRRNGSRRKPRGPPAGRIRALVLQNDLADPVAVVSSSAMHPRSGGRGAWETPRNVESRRWLQGLGAA
jgi:hypothetical protein